MTLGQVRQARQRYQPGASVDVYYDPEQPGRAVLEPGATQEGLLQAGAGAVTALLGLLWLVKTG